MLRGQGQPGTRQAGDQHDRPPAARASGTLGGLGLLVGGRRGHDLALARVIGEPGLRIEPRRAVQQQLQLCLCQRIIRRQRQLRDGRAQKVACAGLRQALDPVLRNQIDHQAYLGPRDLRQAYDAEAAHFKQSGQR